LTDCLERRIGRRRYFVVALVLVAAAAGAIGAAAGSKPEPVPARPDMWDPEWVLRDWWSMDPSAPGRRERMARHQHFIDRGVPDEYRGARNPYAKSPEVIAEGGRLYLDDCVGCHGPLGMGDGDMALAVNPSPALLAFMVQTPLGVDEYLMWSISEGGPLFGSGMPAFKGRLSIAEIWKIIAYMRAGFPRAE
jgi:mono/diheme cytochrome c family protein